MFCQCQSVNQDCLQFAWFRSRLLPPVLTLLSLFVFVLFCNKQVFETRIVLQSLKMESQDAVNITINRPVKVLYFSDGVEEFMEETKVDQQESEPDSSQVDAVSILRTNH